MAHRQEPPSRDAMLKRRVGSLTKELAALHKAGKASSKTFHSKLDRLHKYQKALRPKREYKPFDYSDARSAASKASTGTKAVAELMKKGLKGPLRQVAETAKAGGERARAKAGAGEKKTGTSRGAYERTKSPGK